ncbi:response regulator transcription factor [Acidaminococcus timonensis]|jgi:two-component system, OmpR family, response regulator ResD|uniref:response regulator transcription factor n=1 Tax=Acidaminococcus TaxID=904 RepID=UPI0025D5129F|nr:response regulator transcription factor [Acidaminococcus timonensis]MDD6569800.1 response regulator transcription factor [Acidaminococcus sp.]
MNKQQTVLIADDEPQIREILSIYFKKEGFKVIEAADGAEALVQVQAGKPDIILLDIMMPVLDGLEVCKQVRKISDIPIIMLTAKDSDDDRILGLEIGADDYISKPFNTREVVARVKAVLRRTNASLNTQNKQVLEYPDLMINLSEYRVVAFGREITFTAKEMELLWCLASNPGIVFSRNQLLEKIWGYTYYGDTRTVDTHIKRVRHKLAIPPDSAWDIMTVWGVGYKFEVKKDK